MAQKNCKKLSFKELNNTSNLFKDFLFDFERVASYYCADFRDLQKFRKNSQSIAGREYPRDALVDILTEQNRLYGFGDKTFENIDKLRDKSTCVVFTGQQVGLLTGPLYTVYKTLTTIKLSERLSKEMGVEVVPIFWMAADDHDFEEVGHVHLLDREKKPVKIHYRPKDKPQDIPMGFFTLDENITDFLDKVLETLLPNDYYPDVEAMIREAYKPGRSIVEAFGIIMGRLFAGSGLILVNPADTEVKQLATPIFKKEIKENSESNQIVDLANLELDKLGYHLQVHNLKDYLNLFYYTGSRSRVMLDGDEYIIEAQEKRYSQEDLLKAVDDAPSFFSPNVILRPVTQDYIFPTLAYIGGPSEVAYFAQIKDLHSHFKVQCPIVYPRISATIVDNYSIKTMQKYDLHLGDLSSDKKVQGAINAIVERKFPQEYTDKIEENRLEILNKIMELHEVVKIFDEGVQKTLDKTRGKIDYELKSLQDKILKAYKKENDNIVHAVQSTGDFLFPEASMQERHLNILTFINRYGMEFMDKISEHLKVDSYDHQVLCLEDMGY